MIDVYFDFLRTLKLKQKIKWFYRGKIYSKDLNLSAPIILFSNYTLGIDMMGNGNYTLGCSLFVFSFFIFSAPKKWINKITVLIFIQIIKILQKIKATITI